MSSGFRLRRPPPQVQKVITTVPNKWFRTAEEEWSSRLGVGKNRKFPHPKLLTSYRKLQRNFSPWRKK